MLRIPHSRQTALRFGKFFGQINDRAIPPSANRFHSQGIEATRSGYLLRVLEATDKVHFEHVPATPCEACSMLAESRSFMDALENQRSMVEKDLTFLDNDSHLVTHGS